MKELTLKISDRLDGTRYVTSDELPGFHFILAKDEKLDAMASSLKTFMELQENLTPKPFYLVNDDMGSVLFEGDIDQFGDCFGYVQDEDGMRASCKEMKFNLYKLVSSPLYLTKASDRRK